MRDLAAELEYAARSLRRRPGFTIVTVAVLALGIGANTAIFSVVDTVLLRSLPYRDVGELVVAFADGSARGSSNQLPTTPGAFVDWREQQDVFEGIAALINESWRITSVEQPVVPLLHRVTANYFDVLGVEAAVGRTFREGEDREGEEGVVILSHGLWQSVFGGDPGLIGSVIALDERPHTVIGVLAPDFYSAHAFAVQPDLWTPLPLTTMREDRTRRRLIAYARLSRGRSIAEAEAAMDTLSVGLAERYPDTDENWGVRLVPLREHAVGRFSETFLILLSAVGIVLLIACANVANLTLARATERARELALRAALGASRARVARQLVTESLLIALAGGAGGVLLAGVIVEPIARMIPATAGVPFLDEVALDGSVLLFTLVVSVGCALVFGLLPARRASRVDLSTALRDGGRTASLGSRARFVRQGLVVAEVTLAVVVAAAAGLLLQSFARLSVYSPGFEADHLLTLRTSLRGEEFAEPSRRIQHFEEVKRRLESIPGISQASAVSFVPPISEGIFGAVRIELPERAGERGSDTSAVFKVVMPDYFETMGIPVLQGRSIEASDLTDSSRVVVINQAMAQRHFPGRDPVGLSFRLDAPGEAPVEIVGVCGDVMTAGTRPAPQAVFYFPHTQRPLGIMNLVMRVPEGNPGRLARRAEAEAWAVSRSTKVYAVETLERRIAELNWRPRFGASLLACFAGLALLLGAAGIYAVIAYSVSQRRSEFGLRMALGAHPNRVLGMVIGSGVRLALLGVALGLALASAATKILSGMLYGVMADDPVTFTGVAFLLLGVAAVASAVPAVRATRIDPMLVLRD